MVSDREFREDLYFRLNVFPIVTPPLRERVDDIPLLVRHFVDIYSQRMNKPIEAVSDDAMERLCEYSWPGNIRELQNFIERSVIMSNGTLLCPSFAELERSADKSAATLASYDNASRRHILKVLEDTQWVIGGQNGAASRLGLKRTTLLSKMDRLGIVRS
jgi:formate hydrogenlyase transcriptional activator